MPANNTLNGSRNMPLDLLLRKMEQTCIYEPESQIDDYQRQVLKDLNCDEPIFESDQPRYNNHSESRLNLRHYGARNPTDPYLEDGTFLDFQFVEKDPRGNALEPDMRNQRSQLAHRISNFDFRNDEDNSVPESGIHPTHMVQNIKGQFYNVKNRMKIFETSMDGRHNGSAMMNPLTKTGISLQTRDERSREMQDAKNYNRSLATSDLSNDTSIGWRRTVDHKFQVARYGDNRRKLSMSEANWMKNRGNTKVDHDVYVSWQDQNMNKNLALKMIDLSKQKKSAHESGLYTLFGQAKSQANRALALSSEDMSGMASRVAYQTQPMSAHSLLRGEQKNNNGERYVQKRDDNRFKKTVIDPHIIQFMAQVNKKMAPRERDDLRARIEQSNTSDAIFAVSTNSHKNRDAADMDNSLMWESDANYIKGESKKVFNYSQVHPTLANAHEMANFEDYKKQSHTLNQRRGYIDAPTQYAFDSVENDLILGGGNEFTGSKLVGGMGSKYMVGHMDTDTNRNALNDITSRNVAY